MSSCCWEHNKISKIKSIKDGHKYKIDVGKCDRNFTIVDNEFSQIIYVSYKYLKVYK